MRFKDMFLRPLIKAQVPNLDNYIGRMVKFPGHERPIRIERIMGSFPKPSHYEINGKYHIGMLRFHAQMEGATDITEEQMRQFEETEHYVEKKKSLIEL